MNAAHFMNFQHFFNYKKTPLKFLELFFLSLMFLSLPSLEAPKNIFLILFLLVAIWNQYSIKDQFTFKNKKVAHHNHITGNYISTCCNKCNLQMRIKRFLPVYIHNLKGYDAHLFINALSKYGYQQEETDKSERLSCIPICLTPDDEHIKNFTIQLTKTNNTSHVVFVTSEDFKVLENGKKIWEVINDDVDSDIKTIAAMNVMKNHRDIVLRSRNIFKNKDEMAYNYPLY
jgi:hypothetical protein